MTGILSQEEISNIAKEAVKYTRDVIHQGSTHLHNNDLPHEQQTQKHQFILKMRDIAHSIDESCIEDPAVVEYQKFVSLCTKYSTGNCFEYAIIALDYLRKHYHNISVEMMSIEDKDPKSKKGDHVFLVINRRPGNPDPMLWEGIFLDAWSEKEENQVYFSSEYLTKLSNYRFKKIDVITEQIERYLKPFNTNYYTIERVRGYSSFYLKNHMLPKILTTNLNQKIENIERTLNQIKTHRFGVEFIDQITFIQNKISNEFSDVMQQVAIANYADGAAIGKSFLEEILPDVNRIDKKFALLSNRNFAEIKQLERKAENKPNFDNATNKFTTDFLIARKKLNKLIQNLDQTPFNHIQIFCDLKSRLSESLQQADYEYQTCLLNMSHRKKEEKVTRLGKSFLDAFQVAFAALEEDYNDLQLRYKFYLEKQLEKKASDHLQKQTSHRSLFSFFKMSEDSDLTNESIPMLKIK